MAGWASVIEGVSTPDAATVLAHTFQEAYPSGSQPVRVSCDDGRDWVVKGIHAGHQAVADQILGRVGRSLGAPVPEVGLVRLHSDLLANDVRLAAYSDPICHGTVYQPGFGDRAGFDHAKENGRSYALLAAFYGLCGASDHQVIFSVNPPPTVMSVDHGCFLLGGQQWTTESLETLPTSADLDSQVVAASPPSVPHLEEVLEAVVGLSDEALALAVASPPASWGITLDARVRAAMLLAARRDSLVTAIQRRLTP